MAKKTTALVTRGGVEYRRVSRSKHRRAKTTIPIAIVAGLAPVALFAYDGLKTGGIGEVPHRIIGRLTGYDINVGKFNMEELSKGWLPILLGLTVHKVAQKTGINRQIARWGIPYIRI